MSGHAINLGFRFLLELAALASAGYCGWTLFAEPLRIVFAGALPIIAAVLWATFAVPDDPSRSGRATVAIPGTARIVLQLAFFVLPPLGVYLSGARLFSIIFASAVLLHYLLSYQRMIWLLRN